jgi:hypothetical protein
MPDISIAQKARKEKALDRLIKVDRKEVITRREFMERLKKQGAISEQEVVELEKKVAFLRNELTSHPAMRETNLSDKELEAEIAAARKFEYRIHLSGGIFYIVSKTEYDYFNSLS